MLKRSCSYPKPVSVIAYIRYRFGRFEFVRSHCRAYPKG